MDVATIKNELTEKERSIVRLLPELVQEYVWMRLERPIKVLNVMEWTDYSMKIIAKCNLDLPPGKDTMVDKRYLQIQAAQFRLEFDGTPGKKNKYAEMTIAEVSEAMKRGARGEAGQIYSWNPATFHRIIKWFYDLPERSGSWMKYLEAIELSNKETEASAEQKMINSKNSLRTLFENYKSTQQLGTCPWFYYGALCDIIGIEVEYKPGKKYKTLFEDPAIRAEVNAVAEKEYQETQEFEQVEEDSIYRKGRADMIAMNRIIIDKMNKDDALTRLKKVAALRRYFDDLIKENKTLQI